VQLVFEELRRMINDIEIQEFKRYKNLRNKFVNIQDAYINTYHPDFMGGANAVLNVFDI